MANSYTAIPNIVPGNLTVNGKLTVSGGQIAVGRYQRKYRIQELANGQFVETVNVDRIAGAQDDAAIASLMRVINATGPPFAVATEPAGSPMTDTYLLNQQPTALQVLSPELRVGAAIPYVRMWNVPVNGGAFSINLQTDSATRDDLGSVGMELYFQDAAAHLGTKVVDVAGNPIIADLRRVFWSDHTVHGLTGSTALTPIGTKTIYANQLGPVGGVLIFVAGWAVTVAGGGATITVNIGGTTVTALTIPASANGGFWVEISFQNRGATNQNTIHARGAIYNVGLVTAWSNSAIDTTANQPITLQYQNVALADQTNVSTIEAEFISRAANL